MSDTPITPATPTAPAPAGVFHIALPDGRTVGIQAASPEEAAQGARNLLAREQGEQQGKAGGVLPWLDNVVRHVANGATFGFADEIAAALDSLTGRKASYDEALAEGRSQDKAFAEKNPIAATGANIAGNVATAVAALPAAATAMGPSLIGNALKTGATGAAMGGLQGFGEGEGSAPVDPSAGILDAKYWKSLAANAVDRLAHAAPGAAFGAAGGAAVPFLGAASRKALESAPGRFVAEKVISPAAQSIASLLEGGTPMRSLSAAAPDGTAGGEGLFSRVAESTRNVAREGAIDRLATALQRSGMSPDQVERRLGQLGPEAMLADTNQQFLSEARRANTLPGETRDYAKTVLESRDRQAGNRLVGAFEGNEPPPSSYAMRGEGQAFDQNRRAVGARAYGDMDEAGLRQTPELMALYENPYVDRAINEVMGVEKNARIGRPDAVPSSPVEIMHKVKQAIWDMGFDQASARPGANASYYRDLGTDFVNRLKAANPKLAEADAAYAQASSLPEFFDRGRSFLSRGSSEAATDASAPGLADLLMGADPQQRLAGRAGMVNAARETALEGTGPARALARRIDESAPVQAKIGELDPARSRDILRQAGAERTFAETSNEILRGSKTADKLMEAIDTGNAGFRVSPQGVMPRFFERLADIPQMLVKPNEPVRNYIGRIALTPDAQQNKEILALAAELMKKRRAGAPARAAIAGSAGASIGRE